MEISRLYILCMLSVVFPQSGEHSMLHARHVKCRWCNMTCACWDATRSLNFQQPGPETHIMSMFIVGESVCAFAVIHEDQVCWPH